MCVAFGDRISYHSSAHFVPFILRFACLRKKNRCIDELQLLLKKCDYQPGDALVFLGDLVAKGPDSCAVVQMVNGKRTTARHVCLHASMCALLLFIFQK